MFGYVIQIRDALFVLGICCVITHIIIYILKLSSTPNTNREEGYTLLLRFSSWVVLLPGIIFLLAYFLFRARVAHSRNNLVKTVKNPFREKSRTVQNPFRKPVNNNNNSD
jgi:uncharacterized membrane protein